MIFISSTSNTKIVSFMIFFVRFICSLSLANQAYALEYNIATVDIVSPTSCTTLSTRLVSCKFKNDKITSSNPIFSGVPVKTIVKATQSGDCQNRFPMTIGLSTSDSKKFSFNVHSPSMQTLRLENGKSFESIFLSDDSAWAARAYFPASCRINLEILLDVPDVQAFSAYVLDNYDLISSNAVRSKLDIYGNLGDKDGMGCLLKDQVKSSKKCDVVPIESNLKPYCDMLSRSKDNFYLIFGEEYDPTNFECDGTSLNLDVEAIDCPSDTTKRVCRFVLAYKENTAWINRNSRTAGNILQYTDNDSERKIINALIEKLK